MRVFLGFRMFALNLSRRTNWMQASIESRLKVSETIKTIDEPTERGSEFIRMVANYLCQTTNKMIQISFHRTELS